MIRERGSKVTGLQHDPRDQRCVQAELAALDEDACCDLCALNTTREQARAAFNMREFGTI